MSPQNLTNVWWAVDKQPSMLSDEFVGDLLTESAAAAEKLSMRRAILIKRAVTSLRPAERAAAHESWQEGKLQFRAHTK